MNGLDQAYIALAQRTSAQQEVSLEQFEERIKSFPEVLTLLRRASALGASIDAAKKYVFYGRRAAESRWWQRPFQRLQGLLGRIEQRLRPQKYEKRMAALKKLSTEPYLTLLHGLLGVVSEAGEMTDALLEGLESGAALDTVNFGEELGDQFWYLALLLTALKLDPASVASKNIAKLKARYPDKFTAERALNRDLLQERSILES